MQKSGLHDMKHHPDGSSKIIMLFSALVRIYRPVHDIRSKLRSQFPVQCSFSYIMQLYFFGCFWHFQIPAPAADNKLGGKPTSSLGLFPIWREKPWGQGWRETPLGPDRETFVIATIIHSSSPPLLLAPRWWEPRDKPQPGFFLEAREPWGQVRVPPSHHHAS